MKNIYIGIDYSLKSPAACIIKDNKCKWVSYPTRISKPKRALLEQEEVKSISDVNLVFQADLSTNSDYSKNEYLKINHYKTQAETMFGLILDELTDSDLKKKIYIGLEGFSYGSTSNNLIDIVAATTAMKIAIISCELLNDFTIDVYSPKSIKKFAGYGMFDKPDLFDVFIGQYNYISLKHETAITKNHDKFIAKGKPGNIHLDYEDARLDESSFRDYCQSIEINRNNKKIRIPKPIDDLIDAYLISAFMVDEFED